MAGYIEAENFVTHNFNTSTCLVNGTEQMRGIHSIVVSRAENTVTTQEVADGTTIFVEKPSRKGMIKLQLLEASKSNDVLWDLIESGDQFSFSFKDSSAPNLDCGGQYAKIEKEVDIKREDNQVDVQEWTIVFTYLKMKGSSYKLITDGYGSY